MLTGRLGLLGMLVEVPGVAKTALSRGAGDASGVLVGGFGESFDLLSPAPASDLSSADSIDTPGLPSGP